MHSAILMEITTLEAFGERVRSLLTDASHTGLGLLLATMVGLVGWAIARLVSRGMLLLLRMARFNEGMRRMLGIPGAPMRYEPAAIASWAIYWTLLLLTLMLAADVLGFNLKFSVGERLAEVLPRVTAATIELVVGISLAIAVGAATRRLFETAGFKGGRLRGQVVTAVLSAFAVLLALEQLGFAAHFILALGITVMAAVGLAAALAFGLGCRDLARDFVVEYLRSFEEDKSRRPG